MNNKPMAKNLTGQKVGRLLVVKRVGTDKHKRALWECLCDCGNTHIVASYWLIRKGILSCGCFRKEVNSIHGMADTPLHNVWKGMNSRCNTKSSKNYNRYGGRGIKICDEWKEFINFYNDMKDGYKKGLSLERKKVNEGYSKSNCIWATSKEQSRNKTNNTFITHNWSTKTLCEWEEISGTHRTNIQHRIKNGWNMQHAIFGKPVQHLSEISSYLTF